MQPKQIRDTQVVGVGARLLREAADRCEQGRDEDLSPAETNVCSRGSSVGNSPA